jgi:hypothetical protein
MCMYPFKVKKMTFAMSVLAKWLPRYLSGRSGSRGLSRVHVLFCMVDHFEPGTGKVAPTMERERMDLLLRAYPPLADTHRDAGGNVPKRTWFLPPHYHRHGNLRDLVDLCKRGYGEVELHLHHGKTTPDTEANLEHTIRLCVEDYSRFGVFGTENGAKRYGFIHGDWALANSRTDGKYCGVEHEIDVLRRTGCYADFTMPCGTLECNPAQINSVYYAKSDTTKRVPYRRGIRVQQGVPAADGLMLVQGPLHPWFVRKSPLGFRACGDAVDKANPATPRRVDCWVDTWIHVPGKPDWLIIKVSTHGAVDADVVLGDTMSNTFRHLETKYNSGQYRLHYVTARELFNIIKAAEAGEQGDPEEYRNYKIAAPHYDSSPDILEASQELQDAVARTYVG